MTAAEGGAVVLSMPWIAIETDVGRDQERTH
jgi:hypothetical protein